MASTTISTASKCTVFSVPTCAATPHSLQKQRLSTAQRNHNLQVFCVQSDDSLRRPASRPVEGSSTSPQTITIPSTAAPSTSSTKTPTPVAATSSGVTIEFQRQKAKEMVAYFQDAKYERDVRDGQVFGWTRKNEIGNGRWTMFGLAVGLLTELATGVNFPEQLKIIVSNLGILDLD